MTSADPEPPDLEGSHLDDGAEIAVDQAEPEEEGVTGGAGKERPKSGNRALLEWIGVIAGALIAAFLIRSFLLGAYVIPSASMYPTLHDQPKDRVIVNKLSYKLHDVHRGDVIVFSRPPKEADKTINDLIKRVIALPGETVQGRGGTVFVNGGALTESYVNPQCGGTADFSPVVVPAHELWVMGDNRCNSTDSRVFGPIEENLVVGRAFVRVWPLGHLGWL